MNDDERAAYLRGVAEAGAVLVGVVAAQLGHDAPVLDRMLQRLGELGDRLPE